MVQALNKSMVHPTSLAQIKTQNKLYKRLVKSKKSRYIELQFNKIKNEITSITRKNKEKNYKKYFNINSKYSKKIWNGIKEIINLKQKSSSHPTSLIDKNSLDGSERTCRSFQFPFFLALQKTS